MRQKTRRGPCQIKIHDYFINRWATEPVIDANQACQTFMPIFATPRQTEKLHGQKRPQTGSFTKAGGLGQKGSGDLEALFHGQGAFGRIG
jgi:hypothetical protein